MRTTTAARELAARMEGQRHKDRAKARKEARGRQLMLDGVHADRMYGLDEQGRRVDLKVTIDGWKAVVGFRRELIAAMDDEFKEGDPIPRATRLATTDVYHAVRAMKHIRHSHSKEIRRNETLCINIDELHALLYTQGLLDESRLREIQAILQAYDAEQAGIDSGYKLLAGRKMTEALEALEQAIWERTSYKRRRCTAQACALLTAYKNRYLWRDRQVMRIDGYERVREDGFRAIRDRRLKSALSHLATKLEGAEALGVACTLVSDRVMISAMRVAKAKIATGKHDDALAIMGACGRALGGEWFKKQLRLVYGFVARSMEDAPIGWREEARAMLEGFARLLGQRNPRYILTELKKTRDAYLGGSNGTLAWMESGNAAVRNAVAGEPVRRALAWVEQVRGEAAGTQLEGLYQELVHKSGNGPKDMAARKELLVEAGRSYEKAAMALVSHETGN
jgi:hypothetical protein